MLLFSAITTVLAQFTPSLESVEHIFHPRQGHVTASASVVNFRQRSRLLVVANCVNVYARVRILDWDHRTGELPASPVGEMTLEDTEVVELSLGYIESSFPFFRPLTYSTIRAQPWANPP